MPSVFRSLVLAFALAALVTAGPYPARSSGNSGATITFADNRYNNRPGDVDSPPGGSSVQSGETSATSEQKSTGDGQQTSQGEASAVSVQQQTGLGGATQTTNNQGVIQALQQAGGDGTGSGTGTQSSNNQVNINTSQLQQNVDGTLVNVHDGNTGVVIVNTHGEPEINADGAKQETSSNNPTTPKPKKSANCLYFCRKPEIHGGEPYCCDDGTLGKGDPLAIHEGKCAGVRALCTRNEFFTKCAYDGQCAASDKCCYDACVGRHICKSAV